MSFCKDFEAVPVCATAADGSRETYFAHYQYAEGAAQLEVAVTYTGADNVPVDLSAFTVVPGACPVFQPDVEYERLCDVQANGTFTEFFCRTVVSFDASGLPVDPVQVDYFALDKITPYVPTGTVGPCPDCPPATASGVLTTWG